MVVHVGKVPKPVHHLQLLEVRAIITLGNEESQNMRIRYLAHTSGKSTFEVNSSRECYPIATPYATVCQEEFGLYLATGFIRPRNVVRTTYDAVMVRASIVEDE